MLFNRNVFRPVFRSIMLAAAISVAGLGLATAQTAGNNAASTEQNSTAMDGGTMQSPMSPMSPMAPTQNTSGSGSTPEAVSKDSAIGDQNAQANNPESDTQAGQNKMAPTQSVQGTGTSPKANDQAR